MRLPLPLEPDDEPQRHDVEVGEPLEAATGTKAIVATMARSLPIVGTADTARSFLKINQPDGFDCPGCAWPEPPPGERKTAEFCENGMKAVAEEATDRRADRDFFAQHTLADLRSRSDYWLGRAGRLTEPMVKRPGGTGFEPISWSDAFSEMAAKLRALGSPDEAVFYTSGRTSNEAAWLYQLLVRCFGTNNLPDCSNMCHEPTSHSLEKSIGIGKGSVRLSDFYEADTIVIVGQNPGTNHPRMLSALERAKRNGARIIAVNPLPEAGLLRFKNPQRPRGILGSGTKLADIHLPIRPGADQALFQLLSSKLIERHDGGEAVVDRAFVDQYTSGFDELATHLRTVDAEALLEATGLAAAEVDKSFELLATSERTIVCWAMGVTQHTNAVSTIDEIVNFCLLGGHIGRPGAGLCPVRGHSNVQGDRTMGVWEQIQPELIEAIERRYGLNLPRESGLDTVASVAALAAGSASVFFGLGGNFARATPDTALIEEAMRTTDLVVNVSTKLNRSHVLSDETSIILPALGRTDRDRRADDDRFVTVEDSMTIVHSSTGMLPPPSSAVRSEVDILCGLAHELLGPDHPVPWASFFNYDRVRDGIAATVHGFADFNRRVRVAGGFELPHGPRDDRRFDTDDGRAHFTVTNYEAPSAALLLQSMRSHDQYNTTIYGHDDRYRGVKGDRHVIFMNVDDMRDRGLEPGSRVDILTDLPGQERCVEDYLVVGYPTPRGSAAAYFPEVNTLIPLDHHAPNVGTPASKAVPIRVRLRSSV